MPWIAKLLQHIILVAHPRLPTACWIYAGKRWSRNGYARAKAHGKERAGHRLMYEEFIGPIPEGLLLDHLCRNRACINPWHCEPVTVRENTIRGEAALFKQPHEYFRPGLVHQGQPEGAHHLGVSSLNLLGL